jgi:cysteine-rich repeat protein
MNSISPFRISRPAPALLAALVISAAVSLAAARAGAQCVGDCNGDGTVGINELILGVNIALGSQPTSACTAFQDGSGMVTIAQLIKGVNDALAMCPVTPTATVGTPPPTEIADTPTETSTPVPTVTPGGTPVCGNGIIEPGETCDDGNTMDGDNCPADCVIHDCQFTQTTLDVDTIMQLPDGVTPGALQIFLRYPDGVVGLPGHGPDALNLLTNLPDDAFTTTPNDVDYGLILVVLGPGGLTLGTSPAGLLATTTFTLCAGATAPPASAFHCTVDNATTVDNTDVTPNSSCSVTLP